MTNQVFTVTRQYVDDRNFNHRVATGLLKHRGTSHVYQHLTSQGGVVDAHVELQTLVLGLSLTMRHAIRLGGTLKLDTTYHDGCRFTMEMPK